MEHMSRRRFQSVWNIAVIICALLAVLTTFIVSCTKAPEGDLTGKKPAETTVSVTQAAEPAGTSAASGEAGLSGE